MLYLSQSITRLCTTAVILAACLFWVTSANAQVVVADGDLEATFSSAPLFSAPATSAIAPTAVQSGTITIANSSIDTESVVLAAVNTNSTGLAEAMQLVVTESGVVLYEGTFDNFFAIPSVTLSDIAPGAITTYTLTATFVSEAGNEYQGTTMGFDLRVGFASGAGVTSFTGIGGGTVARPPTPGVSNDSDGLVAGVATSAALVNASEDWPWWENIAAAIQEAVAPDRNVALVATTATTSLQSDVQPEASDENVAMNGSVAGVIDQAARWGEFCILFWFILLTLLGVAGRYMQTTICTQSRAVPGTLGATYLLLTAVYVVGLCLVVLLTTISPVWGWLLFILWVLYQLYDYVLIWSQIGRLCLVRSIVLLIGVALLFVLPYMVNWLCIWW